MGWNAPHLDLNYFLLHQWAFAQGFGQIRNMEKKPVNKKCREFPTIHGGSSFQICQGPSTVNIAQTTSILYISQEGEPVYHEEYGTGNYHNLPPADGSK
jgi:hypothetical protein